MAANNIYLPFLYEENHHSYLYRELIKKAQERNWTRKSAPCYVENHHIWPDSLGGPDESWNLVFLTASEHYYAHYYLMKMLEDQNDENYKKMIYACWQMNNRVTPGEDLEFEASIYEEVRKIYSYYITGENNPFFGKKHSIETISKIKNNKPNTSGENNPMFGKTHTDRTKQKQSEKMLKIASSLWTEEKRKEHSQKMSGKMSGKNNPMYGVSRKGKDSPVYGVSRKGKANPNSKRISIDNIEFECMKDAAKYFGKQYQTIWKWIKLGKFNSFYLD